MSYINSNNIFIASAFFSVTLPYAGCQSLNNRQKLLFFFFDLFNLGLCHVKETRR